ncbi:helix-turn-helix domain-containing protein [Paenibacillus septentrionalis]|uniref:Helix-turn-helix domain-containing protein n=1 Tax=Paenibacillus septentrionalis TaxID=429342 RepID=A0ABW1V2Z5_9BACL
MKTKTYTIGEMSKLSNLPIQTLRYYDQIDLFKPIRTDPNSNYRYYDDSQLHSLDLIKALRYLEIPLATIRQVLDYTLDELVAFLAEQETVIDSRIKRLHEVQNTLLKTKKQISDQLAIPVMNEVYESTEDELRLLRIEVQHSTPEYVPDEYFISLIKTVENEAGGIATKFGAIYPLKAYRHLQEIQYDYLFTPLLTERDIENLDYGMTIANMSGSRYLCISFLSSIDNYVEHYNQLLHYIEKQQCHVASDVYEFYLPTTFSSNQKPEFIVQLKVKIIDGGS